MQVEKNDVDVSRLFSWEGVFELGLPEDEVKTLVFMRLIGDEDMNKARVYALRRSREKRLSLEDVTTDESIALIPTKGTFNKQQLVDMIVMFSARELSKEAVRQVKLKLPKLPEEDATLVEQENYQFEIDSYNGKLEKKRLEFVQKGLEVLKKQFEGISEDILYDRYKEKLINEFCEMESLNSLKVATTFYGTYKDQDYKIKFFDDVEEINNLPSFIKNQFIEAYQSLEIGGEELKKLQGAMQ